VVCLLIQFSVYQRLLAPGLRQPDPERRRAALLRWFTFAVLWQLLVLVLIAAYGLAFYRHHPPGLSWVAPPVGAVIGTAAPLQIAALRIARSLRS